MKANFFTESILYWLARGLSGFAQGVPPAWNVRVGRAAGALLYHLLPSRRVVALDNLRAAFGGEFSPEEYRQIVRGLFQNLGMTFMEMAAIPRIDREYVDKWITIAPDSRSRLDAALAKGHGVILLTGHFGNWELIGIVGALRGYPSLVLAREQGWPRLNRLLTQYRESKGCRVVNKGFPVRELIQGLREGRVVGILADQDGGGNGILSPFFGRLASTAPGTIALSLNTQAPILPIFMIRTHGAAHTLIVEEPLSIPEEGTLQERIRAGLAAYLALLERTVRRTPSEWLWLHRRWKSTPERKVLILSDGKAGHLTQSKALAQRVAIAWEARASQDKRLKGISKPLVSMRTVQVTYRHPGRRAVLSLISAVVPRWLCDGDFWLKWALDPTTYRELQSEYANVSISCGAATAPVHLLWAWQIRCKTIQILRTTLPSSRRFQLSVLPRHDLSNDGAVPSNVWVMEGALVPLMQSNQEQWDHWRDRLNLSQDDNKKRIGLLLGGAAKGVQLGQAEVEPVVRGLLSAADRWDAELLMTSSRRTSPEVEAWLAEALNQHPRCRLLVLVNRMQSGGLRNTQEAIPCILGVADALVVSGDSISMVCEAVATGKPVICFPPSGSSREGPNSKYHRFLQQMERQGHVQLAMTKEVGEVVGEVLANGLQRVVAPTASPPSDPMVEFLKRWL